MEGVTNGDLHYQFYRFKDLLAANIVTSRFDLSIKIRDHGFPAPLKNSSAIQATEYFRKSDVHDWLDAQFPQKHPASPSSPRKEPI